MNKKFLIIGGVITVLITVFLIWLFIESSKPLPGEKLSDLGRGHVPVGEKVDYNSNPPTSGKHYEEWVRAGVYTEPKDDRNLVHSLEHGYVIMSYKCAELSEECKNRRDQLAKIYEKKKQRKLIVVPRVNLDTKFALTAWIYLDKFDPSTSSGLTVSEVERIEKFIDVHINQGPEKTME